MDIRENDIAEPALGGQRDSREYHMRELTLMESANTNFTPRLSNIFIVPALLDKLFHIVSSRSRHI